MTQRPARAFSLFNLLCAEALTDAVGAAELPALPQLRRRHLPRGDVPLLGRRPRLTTAQGGFSRLPLGWAEALSGPRPTCPVLFLRQLFPGARPPNFLHRQISVPESASRGSVCISVAAPLKVTRLPLCSPVGAAEP